MFGVYAKNVLVPFSSEEEKGTTEPLLQEVD